MGKPDNTGIRRIIRATGFSAKGLAFAWRNEAAFRQELALTIILTPVGLWLGRSPVERMMLIATLLLVLIVELLNSAVEATVDRIGAEHHELAGSAKDMGSAAVMISLIIAGVAWGVVAYERFFT